MKGFHRIEEDITDLWGVPYWEWMSVGKGLLRMESILAAWEKFNREYPEEEA